MTCETFVALALLNHVFLKKGFYSASSIKAQMWIFIEILFILPMKWIEHLEENDFFFPGCNVYFTKNPFGWDWFVVHLSNVWSIFSRCYDTGEFLKIYYQSHETVLRLLFLASAFGNFAILNLFLKTVSMLVCLYFNA